MRIKDLLQGLESKTLALSIPEEIVGVSSVPTLLE